jgi:hypothetical protein
VAAAAPKPAAPLVLVVAAHVVPPVAALLALALEVFARYDHQQRADSTDRSKRGTPTKRDGSTSTAGAARQASLGPSRGGGTARRTGGGGDPTGIARLARQVEDAFVEREVRGGERLVAASLTVELEGDDRRKRRVQEMLRQLRTAPTPQQWARIDQARSAAHPAATASHTASEVGVRR